MTGRIVNGAFRPHPLFRAPHVQTILPVLRPTPRLAMRVERLELPDGDFMDLGWSGEQNAGPLAVLLHGLTGDLSAKYARGLAIRLIARGWRCVAVQFRGAGPEPNRLPRSYHHGESGDLRIILSLLRERFPETPLHAVGWSLGGNVLLKCLGEDGVRSQLASAVAVSVPFQLKPCAERLRTGFSRIYMNRLLGDLKDMIAAKAERMQMAVDLAHVLASKDFFDFDNRATAILHGFRDADDYYAKSSCGNHLAGIRVKTLIIHALDDPFMVPSLVPEASALPDSVTLELCERGGHVGFIGAGPFGLPRWWLEDRIPEFLAS